MSSSGSACWRASVVATALAAGPGFGAPRADPWLGSWVLDPDRSACEGTNNVQRYTLTLQPATGEALHYVVDGMDSNQKVHMEASEVVDGKPARLSGVPGYADTITVRRSHSHLQLVLANGGKPVEWDSLTLGRDHQHWTGLLHGILRGQPWVCRWLARKQ